MIADRDNGLMVFSVADPSSARYIVNIPVNRNSGLAASGTTIFANSGDSIVAYCLKPGGEVQRLGGIKLFSYEPDEYVEQESTPLLMCTPFCTPVSAGKQVAPHFRSARPAPIGDNRVNKRFPYRVRQKEV